MTLFDKIYYQLAVSLFSSKGGSSRLLICLSSLTTPFGQRFEKHDLTLRNTSVTCV